jgi:hypothetical protein
MCEKYCVLPGQEPVQLITTEGGHACIIGETPREIPEMFEAEAVRKGCFTETMVKALQERLKNGSSPEGSGAPEFDAERAAQIKSAAIEIINAGNPADLSSGKPKVAALAALVGFEVSAAERDAALAE